eukprot:CAMPEP_0114358874 /NCGR_PEP_ID=MMETSP0101-20121206/22590_1 /TAXON_ID=38822 ORGANISM="Pteridomonas danica, Strain PT" /NCGR_SAMPLE_ID=MMETSP0101 /ASSEMBLY_ACC=CAM_ASM_000211 /LENGTH=119 /DNA_ID=CAMNT_0001502127 /DNA_START=45 /DNA_END=405 /DNA_ORIENTATION=-
MTCYWEPEGGVDWLAIELVTLRQLLRKQRDVKSELHRSHNHIAICDLGLDLLDWSSSGASTRLGTGTGRSLAVALSHKEARFTKTTLTLLHTACPNKVVTESDSAVASNTSTTAIKEMT